MIEGEDFQLAKIAEKWGCTRLQVQRWIDLDDDRRARVEIARQNAADVCDRKAEQVLLDLRSDATAGDIARARELASHYRWQARVRNPQRYGDHKTVGVTISSMPAEQMSNAELYAIAKTAGLTGCIIEGFAADLVPDQDPLPPGNNKAEAE